MKKLALLSLLLCMALTFTCLGQANAYLLAPSDPTVNFPTAASLPGGLTSVATITGAPFTFSLGGISGLFNQTVYRNASNKLIFAYSFTNNAGSLSPIVSFSVRNFTGYTTDINAESDTTTVPDHLTRSSASSVDFGWDHNPSTHETIQPGMTTTTLWILTDAEEYAGDQASFIGGGSSANTFAYGPRTRSAIPEPGTMMLLGMGLVGLVAGKSRKKFMA